MTYPHNGEYNMQQQNGPMNNEQGPKRPIASFKQEDRKSIETAVWENFTRDGERFLSVSFSRSYESQKGSDNWVTQKVSLNDRDLRAAIQCLIEASEFIAGETQGPAQPQMNNSHQQPQQGYNQQYQGHGGYQGGNNNNPPF